MSAVYAPPSAEPRWYRQFWPWVLLGLPALDAVRGLVVPPEREALAPLVR